MLAADFGDAPAPYATLLAANGAQHADLGAESLRLGATITYEEDGQPSAGAGADTGDDGVVFGAVRVGQLDSAVTVSVANAPAGAKLDAWIDFDGDGVWSGANEKVFHNVSVVNGFNRLFVDVPATVKPGQVYARFRLSTAGGLGVGGAAADGEVEDYAVTILPPREERAVFGEGRAIDSEAADLNDLVAIDLDQDGDMDVVTASSSEDAIAWYKNFGTGGFTRQVISSDARDAASIFVTDLDRDGDLDVISASLSDNMVEWHENNGAQQFTRRVIVANEYHPSYVGAADIDSDGDLDILFGSRHGEKIAWLENNGSQQFTQRVVTNTADTVSAVKAADLDRDGDLDLVATGFGADALVWYENDGREGFTRHALAQNNTHYDVATVDLDADGDLDILVATVGKNGLRWFENQGNGIFVSRSPLINDGVVVQAIAADIDGDGDLDVLNRQGAWLLNDGQQNFVLRDTSSNTSSKYAIADIDGDGVLDLVVGLLYEDSIEWRKNGFSATLLANADELSESAADAADYVFSIDGARDEPVTLNFSIEGTATAGVDFALSGHDAFDGMTGTITVPAGETSVTLTLAILDDDVPEFDESVTVSLAGGDRYKPLGASTHSLTLRSEDPLGDYGDAPAPYLTALREGGALHLSVGTGSLRIGAEVSGDADGQPSENATEDDGDDGVVFGPLRVGQLGAEVTVTVSNAPVGAKLDAWIDFNGDGSWSGAGEQVFASVPVVDGENLLRFDVPTVIASGVVTYARFRVSTDGGLGQGGVADDGEVEDYAVTMLPPVATQGVFGSPTQLLPGSAIAWPDTVVMPADLDNDGDLDLVVSGHGSSTGLSWYENLGISFAAPKTIGVGAYAIRFADLDGDGDLDIVASEGNLLVWYENRASEGFVRNLIAGGVFRYPFTPLAVADFDSDGWLDIATVASTGNILVWRRTDASSIYASLDIGSSGSIGPNGLEAADLDGDGRLDLVVAGNGFPFGDTIGFFQTTAGQFTRRTIDGTQSPASIPVDLDEDGDIDLIVQTDAGVLWLENSGTGSFTLRNVGVATGNPNSIAAADFDGDGDIDIVDASRATSFQSQSFTLFTNDGLQRFQGTPIESGTAPLYNSVFPADMDGDGTIDLVAVSPLQGVRFYRQTPRATPTSISPNVLPESGAPITVRLELQTEASTDLVIPFTISGEAVHGVDYVIDGASSITGNSGLATITAGARWVELTLSVIADDAPELFESLTISAGDRPKDRLVRWIASDADAGDYGDAPATYPVGVEQSGAAHLAVGPRLGANRTTELEGVATGNADGDAGDDGVVFGTLVVGAGSSTMTVDVQNAPEGAYIDAWIDFNGDGSWSGEREQVFARRAVLEGENVLRFETPGWATAGVTYARMRLSSAGGLGVMGNAVDGEVEDYQVTIATAPGGWVEYEVQGIDPTGTPSTLTKAVDLDRDGLVDIIGVGLPSDRNLYWLRNAGDGTFSKQVLSVVDFTMRDFAIDDIDGDGDLDIVVASQPSTSGSRLVLLRNDGANSFTLSVIASNVEASRSVTLVDLNGDGTMNIVAGGYRGNQFSTSSLSGEIAWYTNDGSGNFTPRPVDSQIGPVVNVGAADLDGDGDLDLYASAMNAGSLLMYRNDGGTSFTKQVVVVTPPIGSQMYVGGRVRAADMDGDGDLDLVAASGTFGPPRVVWHDNNGDGVFVERVVYAIASYSNDILPADLDGDGDLDLAMAYVPGAPGDRPAWIETRLGGDVNNDGVVDLADRDFWRANYGSTSGPGLIADLTGDGLVNAADYTSWRDAYESGVASIVYLPRFAPWTFDATSLAAADLDGDLDLDLIAVTSTGIVVASNASLQPTQPAIADTHSKTSSAFSVATINWPLIAESPAFDAATPRRRYTAPLRRTDYDRSIELLCESSRQQSGPMALQVIDEAFADATEEPTTNDGRPGLAVSEEMPLEDEVHPWDWD